MRGTHCFFPALRTRIAGLALADPELHWYVEAALALNEDLAGLPPPGDLWEYSVGWAASQCARAALVLGLERTPRRQSLLIEHAVLTIDLRRTVQLADWNNPRRALCAAARLGYCFASTRVTKGEQVPVVPLGMVPRVLEDLHMTPFPTDLLADGDALMARLAVAREAGYHPNGEAAGLLLGFVPVFGHHRLANRETMWRLLTADSSWDDFVRVVAVVKLLCWFALADIGEITSVDRMCLNTGIGDEKLDQLLQSAIEFVPDEVLS